MTPYVSMRPWVHSPRIQVKMEPQSMDLCCLCFFYICLFSWEPERDRKGHELQVRKISFFHLETSYMTLRKGKITLVLCSRKISNNMKILKLSWIYFNNILNIYIIIIMLRNLFTIIYINNTLKYMNGVVKYLEYFDHL